MAVAQALPGNWMETAGWTFESLWACYEKVVEAGMAGMVLVFGKVRRRRAVDNGTFFVLRGLFVLDTSE